MRKIRLSGKENEERLAIVQELKGRGYKNWEIANELGITVNSLKSWLRIGNRRDSIEKALEANDMPDNWDRSWVRIKDADGNKMTVALRNKEGEFDLKEWADNLVERVKHYAPKYKKHNYTTVVRPHLLVVNLADIHLGKYASAVETGDEYTMKIAYERCISGLHGLIDKSKGFKFDQILFVAGNDIIHIDSPHRKTTAGTPQDTDGQWHEAYNKAIELYVECIETLIPIAPVTVHYNPSNHDFMMGYCLMQTIEAWFRNCEDVAFDCSPRHRKYFKYHKNLIGTSHGDGAKQGDYSKLMSLEAKQYWADSEFYYWYLHHIHHKVSKDDMLVTIEYLRSPSGTDGWHDRNGYKSPKAVEAFIHHPYAGQVARITNYL